MNSRLRKGASHADARGPAAREAGKEERKGKPPMEAREGRERGRSGEREEWARARTSCEEAGGALP